MSRGQSQRSRDLIEASQQILSEIQPATVRAVCYRLFTSKLIDSMRKNETNKISRLLTIARENEEIPWEWIVDETRELEICSSWADPAAFVHTVSRAYRRDFWLHQPRRVLVVSEKGTVLGVLAPVLDKLGVGFRVMHGFSSATAVYDIAQDCDGRSLIILYIGDYDPSGMFMSEVDLPERLAKYDGDHVRVKRIALTQAHHGLPWFPASDKKGDTRYPWFVRNYGDRCWELDALDPNDLRALVDEAIRAEIEPVAWKRCAVVEKAEQESLRHVLDSWNGGNGDTP